MNILLGVYSRPGVFTSDQKYIMIYQVHYTCKQQTVSTNQNRFQTKSFCSIFKGQIRQHLPIQNCAMYTSEPKRPCQTIELKSPIVQPIYWHICKCKHLVRTIFFFAKRLLYQINNLKLSLDLRVLSVSTFGTSDYLFC